MSRKHNCLHRRAKSHYRQRLEARGLGRTPVMRDFVGVGKRTREEQSSQGRRP